MKVIQHPRLIEELSRKLEIEKFNFEISQMLLDRKSKSIKKLARKIYTVSFFMFLAGVAFGSILTIISRSFF